MKSAKFYKDWCSLKIKSQKCWIWHPRIHMPRKFVAMYAIDTYSCNSYYATGVVFDFSSFIFIIHCRYTGTQLLWSTREI